MFAFRFAKTCSTKISKEFKYPCEETEKKKEKATYFSESVSNLYAYINIHVTASVQMSGTYYHNLTHKAVINAHLLLETNPVSASSHNTSLYKKQVKHSPRILHLII